MSHGTIYRYIYSLLTCGYPSISLFKCSPLIYQWHCWFIICNECSWCTAIEFVASQSQVWEENTTDVNWNSAINQIAIIPIPPYQTESQSRNGKHTVDILKRVFSHCHSMIFNDNENSNFIMNVKQLLDCSWNLKQIFVQMFSTFYYCRMSRYEMQKYGNTIIGNMYM